MVLLTAFDTMRYDINNRKYKNTPQNKRCVHTNAMKKDKRILEKAHRKLQIVVFPCSVLYTNQKSRYRPLIPDIELWLTF